jgi:hypothetical protein
MTAPPRLIILCLKLKVHYSNTVFLFYIAKNNLPSLLNTVNGIVFKDIKETNSGTASPFSIG